MTRARLCRPRHKPRGLVTNASCRAACLSRLTPTRLGTAKDPFHRDAPPPLLSRPEAPSANESHLPTVRAGAWTAAAWAATGASALPPWPSFRHAFTHRFCALDPVTYRLFTGAQGPHAVRQLLQCP
jgi:hypothetical protein